MTTLRKDIIFGTAEHFSYRMAKQLAKYLIKFVKLYVKGFFVVINVLMDGGFEKFKPEIILVDINISAAREHVAEIEQYHRTLK